MRLKKCVLSFLRKLVRDEISLMSDGNAFQARGLAMEKALSVKWSRVCETTKLPHTLDRSRLSSQRRTSSVRYRGPVPWLMSHIKVHSLNCILLDTGSPAVELLQERWCMRPGRSTTEEPGSSILHTLQTVKCSLWAASEQTVAIVQTWPRLLLTCYCLFELIAWTFVNI